MHLTAKLPPPSSLDTHCRCARCNSKSGLKIFPNFKSELTHGLFALLDTNSDGVVEEHASPWHAAIFTLSSTFAIVRPLSGTRVIAAECAFGTADLSLSPFRKSPSQQVLVL